MKFSIMALRITTFSIMTHRKNILLSLTKKLSVVIFDVVVQSVAMLNDIALLLE
jgi:hypothetical protein